MLNRLVEAFQMITRHRRIHMMLRVVIHLPVKKTEHRVEYNRAAAQSKIRHIVLQAHVLRVVAEEEKPPTIKGG